MDQNEAKNRTTAERKSDRELVIRRTFNGPAHLVFKAWTDPERAAIWWAPQGFALLSCEMDVRPGGRWRRSMQAPDGAVFLKHGVYREVVPPERLVFTYVNEEPDGTQGPVTLVTVTLAEEGQQTKLTLHHTGFEAVADRDSHQGGWTTCLERFARYLAAG